MSNLVPAEQIEQAVGARRHAHQHLGRAVSAEQTVYVLHSQRCKDTGRDLRDCLFSQALDNGIDQDVWSGHEDKAVRVTITRSQRLVPVTPETKWSA